MTHEILKILCKNSRKQQCRNLSLTEGVYLLHIVHCVAYFGDVGTGECLLLFIYESVTMQYLSFDR